MLPYIDKAVKKDYAVVVCNPNPNSSDTIAARASTKKVK